MGDHRAAWDGMTLLVFDPKPLLPMTIEQTIAMAAPWLETKVESFEAYDDALAYCRDRRDVGLIIMSDDCAQHAPEEVFRNLSAPYETAQGWPAAAVLYGASGFRLEGFRAMSTDRRFLEYVKSNDLTEEKGISVLLEKIWGSYTTQTESLLFPDSMQRILFALANACGFGYKSQAFAQRVTTLVASDLNVSWYDMIALRWAHIFDSLKNSHPEVLDSNRRLTQLVSSVSSHFAAPSQIETVFANKSIPLAGRLGLVVRMLSEAQKHDQLTEILAKISASAVPGSPALLRAFSRHAETISRFDAESNMDSSTETFKLGKAV